MGEKSIGEKSVGEKYMGEKSVGEKYVYIYIYTHLFYVCYNLKLSILKRCLFVPL